MHTAIGPWRMRSSSAHCEPELAKRIDKTLGEEDWRDTWQRGLARRKMARSLAKTIGEALGEEDWRGGEGGGG